MRKISFFICSILVVLMVVTWMADIGLKEGRPGWFAEWNDIIQGDAACDTLVMGSSRACVQVSPAILERELGGTAYNLGMDGYMFDLQKARYDLYRKYNKKPKTIVQVLDAGSFQKRDGLYRHEQFYPYYDEKIVVDAIKDYEGFSPYRYYLPMFKYLGEYETLEKGLAGFLNLRELKTLRVKGYLPQNIKWNASFEKFKKDYPQGRVIEIDPAVKKAFEDYLATAKNEGIDVILVYAPEYVEVNPFLKNKPEIIALYESIARERGVRFYDFSDSYLSMDKRYMYDSQHLNKRGAELFTQKIAALVGDDNTYDMFSGAGTR